MKKFKFTKKTNNLFKVILSLKTVKESEKFFRDLCTSEELRAMTERWKMVQLLNQGLAYRKIAEKLNVSTTTVARVSYWLNNGMGGYKIALDRLNTNSHHHNSDSIGKEL